MTTTESLLGELRLRQLIESIDDAVLLIDLDDERVVDVNEHACSLYAMSRAELAGAPLQAVSDDFARWAPIVRAKLRETRFFRFDTIRRRRDGAEISLKVQTSRLDAGERMMILSIHQDITPEVRMRQQLEVAAAEWQLTFDAIDEAVLLVDDGGIIQRANRSARALAGSAHELIGARLADLPQREPWIRAARLAAHVLAERTPMSMQTTDCATQQTWDLSAAIVSSGTARAVVAMKDISDIVTLEASARRNERIAEMGHLVGAVAHEVRNPLFVISASFDALQARLGNTDPIIGAHVKNLREQIDRLSALMHDLLEYGKPPDMHITIAPLDVAISDALARVAPLAMADSNVIINEFPRHLGPVLMDRGRMARAIQNLLENAIHHSPSSGTVGIRGGTIEHSSRTWIWCSIEDSGPGFGAVDPARVFEPFFSKRLGGTGLGLSIVQRTIEMHGGRIVASNSEMGGARMTFELPLAEE